MTRATTMLGAVADVSIAIGPADAISVYLWKNRPVVVFAGQGGEASLAEQRRIFAGSRAALAERNVTVVWVIGNTVKAELGPGPGMTAAQLRARFEAPVDGFRVILVGKDGGVKLTRSTPLLATAPFGTIDSMPMRRSEIRRSR